MFRKPQVKFDYSKKTHRIFSFLSIFFFIFLVWRRRRICRAYCNIKIWAKANYGSIVLKNWRLWSRTSLNSLNWFQVLCVWVRTTRWVYITIYRIHASISRWSGYLKFILIFCLLLFTRQMQILLLKTGSFELAIVRMSRLMDLSQNVVLYGDVLLPQNAFYSSDCFEMKLVACIFETAKSIAELKLTETELALYQSLVLLWPGKIYTNLI